MRKKAIAAGGLKPTLVSRKKTVINAEIRRAKEVKRGWI